MSITDREHRHNGTLAGLVPIDIGARLLKEARRHVVLKPGESYVRLNPTGFLPLRGLSSTDDLVGNVRIMQMAEGVTVDRYTDLTPLSRKIRPTFNHMGLESTDNMVFDGHRHPQRFYAGDLKRAEQASSVIVEQHLYRRAVTDNRPNFGGRFSRKNILGAVRARGSFTPKLGAALFLGGLAVTAVDIASRLFSKDHSSVIDPYVKPVMDRIIASAAQTLNVSEDVVVIGALFATSMNPVGAFFNSTSLLAMLSYS
ncbi:MAG: hypothetical protein Q7S68_05520 [Deltaproteobacteria bacterium]|nr:hypothetical protein [Deltaproteobacteria bacterium]